jgi:methylthioribose-1-phosphate isomerase
VPLKIETLRWVENRLEIIDQRILPSVFNYVSCWCALDVAKAIKNMTVRGAPAIGVAAAYGIALEAQRHEDCEPTIFTSKIESAFEQLGSSRPTAVNLSWALKRMKERWLELMATNDMKQVSAALLSLAQELGDEDVRVNRRMGQIGAKLLPDVATVLTHCNAGALATVGYGTALGILRAAVALGKEISVIADETRPFLQGARLTAWEMVQEGIPCTLITDNMSGYMMSKGEIDAVIVGADRVAANGDVANKIGTYMVAVLARRHKIPFYVACPLSTIDLSVPTGADIPIEERAGDEVRGFGDCNWAAEGVRTRNPSFDITPAELVTALITEKGLVLEPSSEKVSRLIEDGLS